VAENYGLKSMASIVCKLEEEWIQALKQNFFVEVKETEAKAIRGKEAAEISSAKNDSNGAV
jgi:hypothetical protein